MRAVGAIQRPDEAEVDQTDHLAGEDQQVARMRIGMEETVASTSSMMVPLAAFMAMRSWSIARRRPRRSQRRR